MPQRDRAVCAGGRDRRAGCADGSECGAGDTADATRRLGGGGDGRLSDTTPPPARGRARTTALIVASAMFMEQLDGTVLATALPTMARSFNADPLHMNVALTSYLLTLAMFIPASGPDGRPLRVAHRVPRRDRAVHAGLHRVRAVAELDLPGVCAHAARHRRRADVTGRASGAAARRCRRPSWCAPWPG